MDFPQTPRTVIEQLISPEQSAAWNGAWRKFFDFYHATVRVMICNSFYRRGWYGVPDHVVDEVVEETVISLNRTFNERRFDPGKSRFRFFLKTVCDRRVVDYLRTNAACRNTSLDATDGKVLMVAELQVATEAEMHLAEEEIRVFRQAVLIDAYTSIRHEFDARTCIAFEMVKFEGVPVETVVRELGVSPNVVNNAVYRITKKLRAMLSENQELKELM